MLRGTYMYSVYSHTQLNLSLMLPLFYYVSWHIELHSDIIVCLNYLEAGEEFMFGPGLRFITERQQKRKKCGEDYRFSDAGS